MGSKKKASEKKVPGLDTPIKVLVSVSAEDNAEYKWFAVALEMDVWGFGNTAQEAEEDLKELVATQIEFATGRKEEEMLDHPAEKQWFDLWEETHATSNSTPMSGGDA